MEQQINYVDSNVVFCDDGHPGVYINNINIPDKGFVYCQYCNKKYGRKKI